MGSHCAKGCQPSSGGIFGGTRNSPDRGKACVRNGLARLFWRKFWWTQKKTSEVPTPQRSRPSSSTPPTSSRCSLVRSRRTATRGGEDRSWFGRPLRPQQKLPRQVSPAASTPVHAETANPAPHVFRSCSRSETGEPESLSWSPYRARRQ